MVVVRFSFVLFVFIFIIIIVVEGLFWNVLISVCLLCVLFVSINGFSFFSFGCFISNFKVEVNCENNNILWFCEMKFFISFIVKLNLELFIIVFLFRLSGKRLVFI